MITDYIPNDVPDVIEVRAAQLAVGDTIRLHGRTWMIESTCFMPPALVQFILGRQEKNFAITIAKWFALASPVMKV